MKQIIHIAAACSMLTLLSACVVHENPAHTKVYTPAGTYDYHCPPGHRKKGWC